jgi:glutaredoxin
MKKLLLLTIFTFAGYKLYQSGFSPFSAAGAFDDNGKPKVVLFVGPGCGEHCDKVRSTLRKRSVSFEEIDVVGADGTRADNEYGIRVYPTTLIGSQEIRGDDIMGITASLAEAYGKSVLNRKEIRAMDNHFDASGRAIVVMYATKWCPYCKRQREYFAANNVQYKEIDVEASDANTLLYNSLEGDGYPLIYVGYRRFPGYQERPILKAIGEMAKLGSRL